MIYECDGCDVIASAVQDEISGLDHKIPQGWSRVSIDVTGLPNSNWNDLWALDLCRDCLKIAHKKMIPSEWARPEKTLPPPVDG